MAFENCSELVLAIYCRGTWRPTGYSSHHIKQVSLFLCLSYICYQVTHKKMILSEMEKHIFYLQNSHNKTGDKKIEHKREVSASSNESGLIFNIIKNDTIILIGL